MQPALPPPGVPHSSRFCLGGDVRAWVPHSSRFCLGGDVRAWVPHSSRFCLGGDVRAGGNAAQNSSSQLHGKGHDFSRAEKDAHPTQRPARAPLRHPFLICHPEEAQPFASRKPADEGPVHFRRLHRHYSGCPTQAGFAWVGTLEWEAILRKAHRLKFNREGHDFSRAEKDAHPTQRPCTGATQPSCISDLSSSRKRRLFA